MSEDQVSINVVFVAEKIDIKDFRSEEKKSGKSNV